MSVAERLYEAAKDLPEPLIKEALDFVLFLRTQAERTALRDLMDAQLAGALAVASWVRTDHIFTRHVSLVAKRFGRISEHVLSRVAEAVCRFIGHPQPVPPADH